MQLLPWCASHETTRTIIDGRTAGFCKLIADRTTCAILGCHVVGERAGEIVQVVAVPLPQGCEWTTWPGFHSHFPPMPLCPGARHTVPPSSSIWEEAAKCIPCVSRVDDSVFALSDEFSVLRARDYVAFSRRKRQQ
jgi:Pyridine nucleotide-disulphide oxidoreductase, dimerisation domain